MAKQIKFLTDYFENGEVKYAKDGVYESNEETERSVVAGHAEYVKSGKKSQTEEAAPATEAPAETAPSAE